MKKSFECIVIGGGLSGAAAAFELSQLGHEVALLENANAGHQKACGEFVSAEAIEQLKEMGIGLEGEATTIQYCRLVSPRLSCSIRLPQSGKGVSRQLLDERMLKLAAGRGTVIPRGVLVKDYVRDDSGEYRVTTTSGDFFARHLFIATAKQESESHFLHGRAQSYIGMRMQFRLSESILYELKNHVMLFTYPAGYGGLTLIQPEVANCSFIFKKRTFALLRGHYDEIRSYLEYFNPEFGRMLKGAHLASEIFSVSNISYGQLQHDLTGKQNLYYLGDQSAVIPSLTGNGIAIALLLAKINALVFHRRSRGEADRLNELTKILQSQMRWSSFGHRLYKTPLFMDATILIAKYWPRGPQMVFERIRDPKVNLLEVGATSDVSDS